MPPFHSIFSFKIDFLWTVFITFCLKSRYHSQYRLQTLDWFFKFLKGQRPFFWYACVPNTLLFCLVMLCNFDMLCINYHSYALPFWYALHQLSYLCQYSVMLHDGLLWHFGATGNLNSSLSWSNTIQSLVRKFVAFCMHRCKLSTHLKTFSWRILQSKLVFKFLIIA